MRSGLVLWLSEVVVKCVVTFPMSSYFDLAIEHSIINRRQAQHRAAMETAARINCSSESFGIAFYCFNCSNCNSELCLFLTRSKCICMHMYRDACLTAVVLFVLTYERCLPWGEAVCVGWRNESRNITPINVQSRAPLSITPVPLRQLELFLTDKFVLSKIRQ